MAVLHIFQVARKSAAVRIVTASATHMTPRLSHPLARTPTALFSPRPSHQCSECGA